MDSNNMSTTALESPAASKDVSRAESIIFKGEDDAFSADAYETATPTSTTPPVFMTRSQLQLDPTAVARIKRREKIQFVALCVPLFLAGYNDGSTGPLLPTMQTTYHLTYTIVSLIFIGNCIGFVSGALSNVWLTERLGFGQTLLLGSFIQILGYVLMIPKPPFPVFVIGYVLNGLGIALQDAQANGFVTTLYDNTTYMNLIHAAYGLGAFTAPLIATQFAVLKHWSLYYCTSLGLSVFTFAVLAYIFKLKTQEVLLIENGHPPSENTAHASEHGTMRQIMGLKAVHTMAFYLLIYVGVEVTLGGWIVTYIIDKRGGGPSSGYISSGFFGGLTLGRMFLHLLSRFIAERHTVYVYALLCLALDLTIWLVPSLIGDAVCVSLIGFFLGPLYPVAMNQASRVIPPRLVTGSIGWMAGFGQAGSALLPFIAGAFSSKFGISSLQPFVLTGILIMIIVWSFVGWQSRGVKRLY